jgi:hypothetical protein
MEIVPKVSCGADEYSSRFQPFCQASFEASQQATIGIVERMFKCCLACLLLQKQGCFNSETAYAPREVGEVDEKEPAPTLSLAQAKELSDELFYFASDNNILVIQAGASRSADYVSVADTLRVAIQRMNVSKNTRQTSIYEFMTGSTSTN